MKEPIRYLGQAKTIVDRGFSAVGSRFDPKDMAARALTLLACRTVALANAVMVLAQNNHAHEALPLLRSLLELTVHARWIAQAESALRAEEFLHENKAPAWEGLWPRERLLVRCGAVGLPIELSERVLGWCAAHVRGNAAGLPWAHVFCDADQEKVAAEEVLTVAGRLMAELVKALDARWPGKFPLDGLQER
jgi:hypothetical protein